MKTNLLLISILGFSGWLQAQDTIRSLIITEASFTTSSAYVELTNSGDSALHLNRFEFGVIHPYDKRIDTTDLNRWFFVGQDDWFMLPDTMLDPGESIVFTGSSLPSGNSDEEDCWYVRYHNTFWSVDTEPLLIRDSIVTDQVGGIFTGPAGQQAPGVKDAAGVPGATRNSILVRKFSIIQGNIDFEKGRGTNAFESEWIVIPLQVHDTSVCRNQFWTLGNHVNAHLGPETLLSNTIAINWTDTTLVIPWGIRRDDPVMKEFTRKPGIAWHYDYSASYNDSAYLSAQTGDVLTLFACGDNAEVIPFRITVSDATADANIVIPKRLVDPVLSFAGQGPLYEVTENVPGMDTIRGDALTANSYAAHIDTLFKYLEGAPAAMWEIVFVDGIEKIFVKNGDLLRVKSESGLVKDYYIKVTGQYINYDAFVTSDIYTVDQVSYNITCNLMQNDSIPVTEFISNLIPSQGASIRVFNSNYLEKTGIVEPGDFIVVTSVDGYNKSYYTIQVFIVNANTADFKSIRIFPIPSQGVLNISGIPERSRITVKDITGRNLIETIANKNTIQISLENKPAGMYFIRISNDTGSVCYKVIVK
ncbi:MAG TPA: T9SS type A sorting domain-containing protein [Bacteroidales bacterium]|nr:T9SS type A sorting domain-containing protein [Bacteroidales bacterium]